MPDFPGYYVDKTTDPPTLTKWTHKEAKKMSDSSAASIRRTKQTIEEIFDKNTFDYFLTITFNGDFVDRTNVISVHNLFKNIVKRLKYAYGIRNYVQVAEYHKDWRSVHYHCCFSFERKPKLKFKGFTNKRQAYFTLQDDFKREDCYITVEKISDVAPSCYLTKYLTKQGFYPLSRRFGCSRGLSKRRTIRSTLISEGLLMFVGLSPVLRQLHVRYRRGSTSVWEYDSERSSLDLSICNIKDETLRDVRRLYDCLVKRALEHGVLISKKAY